MGKLLRSLIDIARCSYLRGYPLYRLADVDEFEVFMDI